MDDYAKLIAETGALLGIEGFEPDAEGVCVLESEEAAITIMFCPEADDAVLLTAKFMDAPPDEDGALMAALEANHRFAKTAGATISIDHDDGSLHLSESLPLAILTPESLVARLESFSSVLLALNPPPLLAPKH